MNDKLPEIVGWYGAAAILGSYALVSFDIIPPSGYAYQLLNLTGAVGLMVISIKKGVRQSVVLNVVWSAVAIVALLKLLA